MTANELVEVVARELAPIMYGNAEYRLTNVDRRRALRVLRAVRDALRDPDGEMMKAGEEADAECEGLDSGKACLVLWAAMIEASPLGRIDDA